MSYNSSWSHLVTHGHRWQFLATLALHLHYITSSGETSDGMEMQAAVTEETVAEMVETGEMGENEV